VICKVLFEMSVWRKVDARSVAIRYAWKNNIFDCYHSAISVGANPTTDNKKVIKTVERKIHIVKRISSLEGYVITLCGDHARKEIIHGNKDNITCKECKRMISK